MLRFLSKQRRARNAFLIFIAFIMVGGLVLLYMPIGQRIFGTVKTASDLETSTAVASVDGEKVTVSELQNALARISQSRFGRGMEDFSMLKSFSGEVLDQLITQRVVRLQARKLGILATDEEVYNRIRPSFTDSSGKFVGFERYRRTIESSGQTIEDFDDGIRYSVLEEKLRNLLTTSLQVSSREIDEDYARTNTSIGLVYAKIEPKKLEDQITVADSDARDYFNQHRDQFKITQLERKADYIFIPISRLAESIQVPEKDLKEEYDRTKEDYTLGATVSEIVLPFTDENQSDVRKKADDLVEQARGKGDKPAEEFAKLGGKGLGYIKKDTKDTSYKQRVFSLRDPQKNVSDAIIEEKTFRILKAVNWKRKSLSEARAEILKKVRERKARDQASQIADDIKKKLEADGSATKVDTKKLHAVAGEFSKQVNGMPVDEMIRHTDFFAATDTLPEFGTSSSSFTSTVASIDEVGAVGNKVYLTDGYAVPILSAKREPKSPEFDEVKMRVITRLKRDRAVDLARARAKAVLDKSPDIAAFERNAKAAGWEVAKEDEFKAGKVLTGLSQSPELDGFALQLKANQVSPRVVKVGDYLLIFGVKSRKDPDLTKLASEKDSTRDRLLNTRKNQIYQDYLEGAKDRLAADGKIVIYQDALDAVFASGEAEATPGSTNPFGGAKRPGSATKRK